MAGRRKLPVLENIEIVDIGSEGKALGKSDEKIVFVPECIPGDVVDIRVTRKRKSYYEGIPIHFHTFSDLRIEPFCEHFSVCGGCKWQHLPYSEQLKFKQKQVIDNLNRIGKVQIEQIHEILPSTKTREYRNKLEFTFSNNRWITEEEKASDITITQRNALGFHIPGMFDKILDIQQCFLQKEPSNAIRNFLREYAFKHELSFFDLRNHTGWLRNLIVRTTTTEELMVIVVFFYEDKILREDLLKTLLQQFPAITSLQYVINSKLNDSLQDQRVISYSGKPYIEENMDSLTFRVGPKSFYQTNPLQAIRLYEKVKEMACLHGSETVYDLYTGTGTIACFVADQAKKVVGIEYVAEAIEDAKINANLNNINNTSFFAGDIKDLLNEEFIREQGNPDVVITDPPRAGMHENVVKNLLNIAPKRIVYVSCNPATQARDLYLLSEKYKVVEVQAVDMFPHTHHVENIALLIKKQVDL